ncbi:MAG: glycine--tRNA ligase [Verrucomicrobia bacterium GWF2_51_19]|nr:MAG: glycine--tRNA ligase [Verrucomicrobia bacterium GWF2_51_19]
MVFFMEKIVSLCKRRGFIFQASEIYGGLNGFFDYGPLGVEMRKNIKDAWWQDMVQRRDDIVGLDSAIIQHPKVWESSGHIQGFSDPMVDCRESKMRYRADQLFWAAVVVDGDILGYVSLLEDEGMEAKAAEMADTLKRKLQRQGTLQPIQLRPYTEASPDLYDKIPSPATGKPGTLTPPRDFNLMFQTYVGAVRDESSVAYLRPETAQGIFTNFKNVVDSTRVKIPFGIAQIGRSFRNEITPRNYIFRSREFEQMEMEFFIEPGDGWKQWHEYWIRERFEWHKSIGLKESMLGYQVHPKEKLAHYSQACTDITFHYPFGVQELEGIAARGCFDLTQHQNGSGKSMEYFDDTHKTKYIPRVIEPAVGVDRTFLALLCSAYEEDEIDGEPRVVLKLHPRIAPIKAAVFPLVKNKPELVEKAKTLFKKLQRRWNVAYDASGAIGRRYRRMDEVGTPFGITVDFETLENGTLTLRDRDTTKQVRLSEPELLAAIEKNLQQDL